MEWKKGSPSIEINIIVSPENTSDLGDEPEDMLELLHLLISLTEDMEEQRNLVRFAGGNKVAKRLISQSSHEIMTERKPALLPSPTGSLISFFTKRLLDVEIEEEEGVDFDNRFSFLVYAPEVLGYYESFNIYAHTGIIQLNMHPLGQLIRRVRGEDTHCGLIEVSWQEEFEAKYLTFRDLNDEKYIKIFQHLATLSDQDIYPDDYYESQRYLGNEIPKILDSLDYRDLFTKASFMDFGKAKDLAYGMRLEDFDALNELRFNEETIPLQKPNIKQIIPLVKVHTSSTSRPGNHCPVCYSKIQCSKGTVCFDDWQYAGFGGIIDHKESGWT